MSIKEDAHAQYCCLTHGCRFNANDQCTVSTGRIAQVYKCGEGAICSEYLSKDEGDHYYDDAPYDA
jgi:hypothetical protein